MNTKESLVIAIRNQGHCPAFKNKKIIARGRLITAPKARRWMEKASADMYSQLKSLFQTNTEETSTEPWQQSAIASWPSDDCWQQIPLKVVRVRKVEKGEEGVIIRIRKISEGKAKQTKQQKNK